MTDFATLIAQFQHAVLHNTPQTGDALAVPRDGFSGHAQMQAYISDYRLRLASVVESDYPATIHVLGNRAMPLISMYVEATPSRSDNINHYPWGFADFLRGKTDGFVCNLAALEAAISRVYQAEDSPALTQAWLQTQAPDYLLTHAMQPRTAFRLLAFEYDAECYFTTFRRGESAHVIHTPSYLAICRHAHQVRRHALPHLAFRLLTAMATLPLGDAIDSLRITAAEENELANALPTWLAEWVAQGFFRQP